MGGTSTRAYSGARQTWIRKGQRFIEKLVFEIAQRVVPVPALWMMNPYKVAFVSNGRSTVLGRVASRCSKDIVRSMSGPRSRLNLLWVRLKESPTLPTPW